LFHLTSLNLNNTHLNTHHGNLHYVHVWNYLDDVDPRIIFLPGLRLFHLYQWKLILVDTWNSYLRWKHLRSNYLRFHLFHWNLHPFRCYVLSKVSSSKNFPFEFQLVRYEEIWFHLQSLKQLTCKDHNAWRSILCLW